LDEIAAGAPEPEDRPWTSEMILHFLTKGPFDRQAALETERRVEARLPIAEGDDDESLRTTLSAVKMLLGKKDEAIRLGEECVARHPVSADPLQNTPFLRWLARLYVCVGENERASQIYAQLGHIPGGFYYGAIKYGQALEPLRKDPRFAEILIKQSHLLRFLQHHRVLLRQLLRPSALLLLAHTFQQPRKSAQTRC
jgi:hypothetical protein